MPRERDNTLHAEVSIVRRVDGSIDTDFYYDRARRLRNVRIADALCAVVPARSYRQRVSLSLARILDVVKHQ